LKGDKKILSKRRGSTLSNLCFAGAPKAEFNRWKDKKKEEICLRNVY
jgi:hypothetical protein